MSKTENIFFANAYIISVSSTDFNGITLCEFGLALRCIVQ